MNTRRSFLTALAAIPFLGWLKPVEAVEPVSTLGSCSSHGLQARLKVQQGEVDMFSFGLGDPYSWHFNGISIKIPEEPGEYLIDGIHVTVENGVGTIHG